MSCNLREYKEFIDNEMLLILGQMDKATLIFDHLYLVKLPPRFLCHSCLLKIFACLKSRVHTASLLIGLCGRTIGLLSQTILDLKKKKIRISN